MIKVRTFPSFFGRPKRGVKRRRRGTRIVFVVWSLFFFFKNRIIFPFTCFEERERERSLSLLFLSRWVGGSSSGSSFSRAQKKATMVFSPKNLQLRRKIRGCFCRVFWCKKSTSRLARNMHHKDTYLRLKTDCNPTSMPRREYQSSCVCVPPGGPPEGILDVAEYIVCRVVFFLFVLVFYPPSTIFFRRSCKFFGEKTIVAKKCRFALQKKSKVLGKEEKE